MEGINSNTNIASSLLGGGATALNPQVSNLLTGKGGGLNSAISGSLSESLGGQPSNLLSNQKASFGGLESYINDNVGDEGTKTKLLSDLSAIQNILETGDVGANNDPIFSLLEGLNDYNSSSFDNSGLLVDSLF